MFTTQLDAKVALAAIAGSQARMPIGRRVVAAAALLLGVSACGIGQSTLPKDPTYAEATGASSCSDNGTEQAPLVVDLKPEERGDLEVAMSAGVVVVHFDCHTMRVLPSCHSQGLYQFAGMTKKEQLVRLRSADEVKAALPIHGATLAASLGQDSSLDVALMMVGKRSFAADTLSLDQLSGSCEGATHFVRAATVGAFVMSTGASSEARSSAEMLNAGVSAATGSRRSVTSKDGDLVSCSAALPGAANAPDQCGAILRLQLDPIRVTPGVVRHEPPVGPCPYGTERQGDQCVSAVAQPRSGSESFTRDTGVNWRSFARWTGASAIAAGVVGAVLVATAKSTVSEHCTANKQCDHQGIDAAGRGTAGAWMVDIGLPVGALLMGLSFVLPGTEHTSTRAANASSGLPRLVW